MKHWKLMALVALSLFVYGLVFAYGQTPVVVIGGDAFAHEVITVSSSAVGLTAATYHPTTGVVIPARTAFLTVEDVAIRYRVDGQDPTSTTGHQVAKDASFAIAGTVNLGKLRMISTAGDAKVRVTYYH